MLQRGQAAPVWGTVAPNKAVKLAVGERLVWWASSNEDGEPTLSPAARRCDYVGAGLMPGAKTPCLPTAEPDAPLARFVPAGSGGSWFAVNAMSSNDTVAVPRKVAYSYWTHPSEANPYNRDGLPASPFCLHEVTSQYPVTASADAGGSISPTGVTTCPKRATALSAIVPEVGNHILEEKVGGVSVGAVSSYRFMELTTEPAAAITPALPKRPAFKHRHDSWQYGNP